MNEILQLLKDQLLLPIITILIGTMVYFVKNFLDQILRSTLAKNEITTLESETKMRNQILKTIDEATKAAVAFNMSMANAMKESDGYLSEEEIVQLNESCINLTINSLPPSLTSDDGMLLKLIGDKDKLIALIRSCMEKYVYEYKLLTDGKSSIPKNDNETKEKDISNEIVG
jgi:hypothetical protein